MRREAHRLRRLAAALGALLLGACAAPGDGLDPPFLTFELQSAGVPAQCTAEDLAVGEGFEPIADDPDHVVAMVSGQPLCVIDSSVAQASTPRPGARERCEETGGSLAGGNFDPSRGPPPSWATGSERLLKSDGSQDPPPEYTPFVSVGGVVQDPTPQPAAPGDSNSAKIVASSLSPAPVPAPAPHPDDN